MGPKRLEYGPTSAPSSLEALGLEDSHIPSVLLSW